MRFLTKRNIWWCIVTRDTWPTFLFNFNLRDRLHHAGKKKIFKREKKEWNCILFHFKGWEQPLYCFLSKAFFLASWSTRSQKHFSCLIISFCCAFLACEIVVENHADTYHCIACVLGTSGVFILMGREPSLFCSNSTLFSHHFDLSEFGGMILAMCAGLSTVF